MSTLENVVSAMSKESNNSTLGWDVVVNYSAQDLNKLLKDAYDAGSAGQLKELKVALDIEDALTGDLYTADYTFQLGAPLIAFEASALMTSSCRLDIPVIGGKVVVKDRDIEVPIPNGRYFLNLTGIALASVNGTKGASRDPKPSTQPFVFNSPNTTGAVALDLETSASVNRLQVEIRVDAGIGNRVPLIESQLANLEKKVVTYFKQDGSSIYWDLAQVNNNRPSSGTTLLVPKDFRFACYAPENVTGSYTILSIFIHLDGNVQGGTQDMLQEKWSVQWSKPDAQSQNSYGVPPIPTGYTASVIFNNKLITSLVKKTVESKGMKIEEVARTSNDTFSVKFKVRTGTVYKVDRLRKTGVSWPYSVYIVDGVTVDLDKLAEPNGALYLAIGQNGETNANALMQWKFSYKTDWSWIHGGNGDMYGGSVTIDNNLNQKTNFDNNALADYRVRLNLHVGKGAWSQVRTPSDSHWYQIIGATDYGDVSFNALPDPPTFDMELFNIDFFMTTNLLLPNSNVINFKADPGVRFPRDLYLVGQIIDKAQVKRSTDVIGDVTEY